MKRKMKKRGEITTKQIVTLIILILSFSVILFLIFRLDLGNKSNAEICRNSVLLKSKSALSQGSLDCRTSYTCIGGDCEGFSATNEIDARTKNETLNALAEEMEQCWWMFGEGEVEYSDTSAFEKLSCSVCSIIQFDEDLTQKIGSVPYEEFYSYLENNQKSNSQTYLQYLYSVSQLDALENLNPENYLENELDPNKEYFILTGIAEDGYFTTRAPWNILETPFESQPVIILENTPENYERVGCEEFVTKA